MFLVEPAGFPEFTVGSVHTLSGSSAYRWIRRGIAKKYEKPEKTKKIETASVKPPENASVKPGNLKIAE